MQCGSVGVVTTVHKGLESVVDVLLVCIGEGLVPRRTVYQDLWVVCQGRLRARQLRHVACEHAEGASSSVHWRLNGEVLVFVAPLAYGGYLRESEEQGVAVACVS